MFTLTTPNDVYTAPTLEDLRAQIVEEWAKYGTSDNIDFADQVHAVFPSELDEDEQLPQVRPLTPRAACRAGRMGPGRAPQTHQA